MSFSENFRSRVEHREEEVLWHVRHAPNRMTTITWSLLIATLPIIALNLALVYLVTRFRVDLSDVPYSRLAYSSLSDGSAYHIDLSPTFLIFVSSWVSSAAPLCAGMLVILGSFPICKAYLSKINHGDETALPIPYQLSLIIRFFDGGSFSALWFWLLYCFGWRRRHGQSAPVKQVALITIMATLLGGAVFLAATWLHISTKSVNVPILIAEPLIPSLSFGLSAQYTLPACSGAAAAHDCAFGFSSVAASLRNSNTSLQVLHSTSDLATVSTYADERGTFAFYSPPPYPGLSDKDFSATTYSLQTQCRPVTQQCVAVRNNDSDFSQWTFNCSTVQYRFEGPRGGVIMNYVGGLSAYFTNGSLIQGPQAIGNPITNPYHLGYATLFGDIMDFIPETLQSDPDILQAMPAALLALECNVTSYDVRYDSIDGSITRFFLTNSNDSVANYFQAPMALTRVGDASLQVSMEAATTASKTVDEVAQKFAVAYSRIALSICAQVMQRNPAVIAQHRSVRLLTRIEMRPFYTLLVVNTAFVLTGLVLAALAVIAVTDPTANDLQRQLSVPGLIADLFEDSRAGRDASHMELLSEESDGVRSGRVALIPSQEGGMDFKLRSSVK